MLHADFIQRRGDECWAIVTNSHQQFEFGGHELEAERKEGFPDQQCGSC